MTFINYISVVENIWLFSIIIKEIIKNQKISLEYQLKWLKNQNYINNKPK